MLGVDFVINALFDTSGFRPGGDCAIATVRATAEPNTNNLIRRMRPTVMPKTRSQSAKQTVAGVADPGLFVLFQFLK